MSKIKGDSSDIKQEEDPLEKQIIELQNDHKANDCDERCTKINNQSSTADDSSKQRMSKEFVCTMCIFKAYSKNHPILHIKNVQSDIRHKCDICDHQAVTKCALNKHKGCVHDGLRYPCNQFDYKAKKEGNLTAHTKTVHEGISFACNMCAFKSRAKSSLSRHKRTIHLTL